MILGKSPRVIFKNTEANAEVQREPMMTEDVRDVNEDPELGIGKQCQEHSLLKEKP